MKSKMKRQRQTELPRVIVGALATAGASMANGATVQITFANNYVANIANGGLTNLTEDLTGDMFPDVDGRAMAAMVWVDGMISAATMGKAVGYFGVPVVDFGQGSQVGDGYISGRVVQAFVFSDARVNGGSVTNGWLDVSASSGNATGQEVRIHRLIFDDASTTAPTGVAYTDGAYAEWSAVSAVPEASSSLALLALGAGGLLTRRRTKRAA